MGSNMNFKNFDGNNGRPMGNPPLARQSSLYSLTFDELQNSMGGPGKDFGSMNMDELLKNIWIAEETQSMMSAFGNEGGLVGGNLQRQGSLTLPRTLSQKTVDEVWRDLWGRDGNNSNGGSNFPHRQQTLGECTLEEFLVRAGVVREDTQPTGQTNNNGIFGEFSNLNNHDGLALGYTPPIQTNGVVANGLTDSNRNINNKVPNQSPNLVTNLNGLRSSQLFQKQDTMGYASSVQLGNGTEPGNSTMRSGIVSFTDSVMNNGFVRSGVGMGMVGLGTGGVTVSTGSPANMLSSDGLGKSNGDMSSLSPVPYLFNGGLRGRKSGGAVEKVVERRQRRMIKNRESAMRSRARKQAYTSELEAELAQLKEENKELQKKQAKIMGMQKNQNLEMINQQRGPKKRCLRRTQTGPL